jgi:hypothetical protein
MTYCRKSTFGVFICYLAAFLHSSLCGQNFRVESNFSPASISSSSRSSYKVVIHGTQQNPQGVLPQVPGLRISNNPQSLRSANFINGVPSVRVELTFQVQADKVGTFTVPPWNLSVEGKNLSVPPATLQVLAPSQKEKQAQDDLRQAAFLELKLPKPYFYEGETILSPLTLFIWDRLPVNRIESVPTKIGDSFSSNQLGKWAEEKRNISKYGKIYSTFIWPISLTAAMAGTKEISFELNLGVRVNSRRNSPFASPFFNDPFFGFGREESLTVKLPTQTIEVRSLPLANRPIDYSGAIGNFSANADIDTDQVEVGDPVRLNFTIQGQGNFAAIPAPEILSNEDFKIGPPAFLFEGDQETKFEGKQNFEFVITPLKSGILKIPPINFSFFDPNKEKYFTIKNQILSLNVTPGETWEAPEIINSAVANKVSTPSIIFSDLFQTASDPGEWKSSLAKTYVENNLWFWLIQMIPLSGVFGLTFRGLRKRNRFKEELRIKKTNLIRKLSESADHREAAQFFRSFKDLLRMQINEIDKSLNAFAFSSDEIIGFIKTRDFDHQVTEKIEDVLRLADDTEFARETTENLDFKNLKIEVSQLLKKVK